MAQAYRDFMEMAWLWTLLPEMAAQDSRLSDF